MRVPRFLSALIRRKTGEYESLDESTNPAQDCDAAHDELNMGHQPGLASLTDEERHQRLLTIIQDCAASQMSLWDQTDIDHLSSANPAKRAISYGRLAMFLKTRYRNTKASVLLETAIHLEREALALYRRACVPPPLFSLLDGFFSQANFHENLAVSLKMRFEATGSSGLLDDAIKLERAALRLSFKSRPHRARLCIRLAVSLSALFRLTGNRAIEDEAIELSREVLIEMCPVGHYARASVCGNLAELLRQRFVRTGESVFLDEATEWAREALDLRPEGHQDRAISCTHLAILLKHRFGQTGDRPLLYGAIRLERQVLSLSPPGHHSRAMACTNLAISLKQRFMETRETALLDEAIKLEQEALTLRPVGHPDRARSCGNLAVSMKQRFHQTKEYVLLYKTIDLEREALVLYPAGHPNRGRLCLNLANSLKSILTILSTDVEPLVLVELSALLDEALAHHPPGHPGRWRCLDQLTDLALLQYDHAAAVRHVQEILSAPTYDNINAVTESVAKMISRLANRITVSSSKTLNLLTLYGDAIGLFARAASFALDSSTQLRHARLGRTLGSGAFMFAARANELSSGLELLERARGVIWAQALHTREYMQGQVAGELIKPLPDLVRAVPSEGPYRNDEISARNQMYAKRGQMHRVVRSIRTLPGHNDFMRGPSVQALLNTAARNTVVVLVADHSECHALIIPSNNHPFIDVAIPGMNERSIQSMGFTNLVAQGRGRATNGDKIERGVRLVKGMSPSYVRLGKLWTIIVKPIINRLGLSKAAGKVRPRVHWCCTGAFAAVPIHAAGDYQGTDQEYCSDYVVSSYTPTLTALLRAQKDRRMFTPAQVNVLAITAEHAQDERLPRLPCVEEEVQAMVESAARAGASVSSDTSATTKGELLAMLKSASVVHFACHGRQCDTEPHESHFCLSTGDLTVAQLMEVDLKHGFFAFLSACETAKGDLKHADEAIHLAAAMLFVGFKSVVASMWAMHDEDGPFVAKIFYEKLFESETIDLDSIPYALDDAVTALRMKGVPPERWATFIHMGA